MPRGASPYREREYDELKRKFKQEGRYQGREEEVAARIVNQQRAQYGETKEAKAEQRHGQAPDRKLPIENYRRLTIKQVMNQVNTLSRSEIKQIENYEKQHKNRKTLIEQLDRARKAA